MPHWQRLQMLSRPRNNEPQETLKAQKAKRFAPRGMVTTHLSYFKLVYAVAAVGNAESPHWRLMHTSSVLSCSIWNQAPACAAAAAAAGGVTSLPFYAEQWPHCGLKSTVQLFTEFKQSAWPAAVRT
jgi:hypothetical protein